MKAIPETRGGWNSDLNVGHAWDAKHGGNACARSYSFVSSGVRSPPQGVS